MLIQFKFRNYKVFRDEVKLSLLPSKYYNERLNDNVFDVPKFGIQLLKSAVIYGANASGKSKLIEAMGFMKQFILKSSKDFQRGEPIAVQPFRLSTETENAPTELELIFIHEGQMFRYGFEVTQEKVVAEWLFVREKVKEVELFYREAQNFEVHRIFKVGEMLKKENLVRDNALMLSVAAQFNDSNAGKILDWLKRFNLLSGIQEDDYQGFTMGKTLDQFLKKEILTMLRHADLGIEDLELEYIDPEKAPKEMRKRIEELLKQHNGAVFTDVITVHRKYDGNYAPVGVERFSLENEESSGTRKFYAMTGPILETLASGNVLVVDEMDSKLHPNLVRHLIEIFNSQKNNPHNAQLIFNTHDTNLLSSSTFRRDQVWFTEKDRYGAATLYSLADVKKVRVTENLEENYIRGKYGAVPYLNDFGKILTDQMEAAQ